MTDDQRNLSARGFISVTHEPLPSHPLWFTQSWRNTGWLLLHGSLIARWRTLIGRCRYCGRADCID